MFYFLRSNIPRPITITRPCHILLHANTFCCFRRCSRHKNLLTSKSRQAAAGVSVRKPFIPLGRSANIPLLKSVIAIRILKELIWEVACSTALFFRTIVIWFTLHLKITTQNNAKTFKQLAFNSELVLTTSSREVYNSNIRLILLIHWLRHGLWYNSIHHTQIAGCTKLV